MYGCERARPAFEARGHNAGEGSRIIKQKQILLRYPINRVGDRSLCSHTGGVACLHTFSFRDRDSTARKQLKECR